eukprot:scaffold8034_cov133-Chaetoceros_neogracile.AAC.1
MSELGWYDDKSAVIDLVQNEEFDGNVIGVNDYSISNSSYTLFVEIKNPSGRSYFLTYNRAEGMNAGTQEAGNKIVVVEGAPNEQSWKLAEIGPGENYAFPDFLNGRDLEISVGAAASSSGINYLPVTVRLETITCNSDSDCRSTRSCTTVSCDSNVCTYSPIYNCCGNGICEESDQGCGVCASDCVVPTHCNEIDGQADTSWGGTDVYYGNWAYGIVFDVDVTTAAQFYELEVDLMQQNGARPVSGVFAKVYTKSGSYANDDNLNNWQLVFNGTSSEPNFYQSLMTFSSKVSAAADSTQAFYISYAKGGQFVYGSNTVSNSDMIIQQGYITQEESENILRRYGNDGSFKGGIKYNYFITSPSVLPSNEPNALPSDEPSILPYDEPSVLPSDEPSVLPSDEPSVLTSDKPSVLPSDEPS